MEFTWTRLMSVGNESIDLEHKALLNMMKDVERAIRIRDARAFSQAIKLFEESVRAHFKNEAVIAHAINYSFETHQAEHQYVLNELQAMRIELASLGGRWSESAAEHYYGFLSTWATGHIAEDDMRMKQILETYPYDFKPSSSPD